MKGVSVVGNEDSTRLWKYIDSAWALRNSAPDSAMFYAQEAEKLAEAIDDSSGQAFALLRQAILLRNMEDLSGAMKRMEQALTIAKASSDLRAAASALANLSQVHRMLGDYEKAVNESLQSISYLEQIRDTARLLRSMNNLANIYSETENEELALHYFTRSLELASATADSTSISRAWFNLGVTYDALNDLEQAEDYYLKSLRYAKHRNDGRTGAQYANSLGALYFEREQYAEALASFRQAETYYDAAEATPERIMVYNNLASVLQHLEDDSQALEYYHRAARLARVAKLPNDLSIIWQNLAGTLEELGEADSALHYYHLHSKLKDSLFNVEKSEQILNLEKKYQSAKKDQSIAELNQVKTAQQAKIDSRNFWLIITGLGLLMLTIAGIGYQMRFKALRALHLREAELQEQRRLKLLQDQEVKTLNAYLDGEATERERIAQELHDRLGSQLTTVKLHYDHLATQHKGAAQEQMETANQLLGEACSELRKIAHELATGVLRNAGLPAAIEQLAASVSATSKLTIQTNLFAMDQRLAVRMEVALFRSIQELVANIIRHAQATEAHIQLVMHDDYLSALVSDNGRGFDSSMAANPGIGLRSIALRMEEISGSFRIDSQIGHGTTAILEVALKDTAGLPGKSPA